MTVQSTRSYRNPQVEQAWRAYLEALQEAQGRRTAEVRRAEDQFRSQVQRFQQVSGDAGNPGARPATTTQAVRGKGGADQGALQKMLAEAEKWVGFNEQGNNGNPFSKFMGRGPQAWCADFVSYLHEIAGMPLGQKGVGFSGSTNMAEWFKSKNAYHTDTPQPGDTVFFNWNGDADAEDHVGIVEKVENGKVYTIEGNSSNGVRRCEYDLGDPRLSGFGSRLRLGNLGQGETPLGVSGDMSGSTRSTPGGGGGSGSSSSGGSGVASPAPGVGGERGVPPSPQPTSADFFAKLISALMEMNDEQRRVLAKSLGKNSEFAKYGQQRMGANFDPASPPLWLALEFIENKLGKLADTPEVEAMLSQLATLDGEALVNTVADLMQKLDAGDPNALTLAGAAAALVESPSQPVIGVQNTAPTSA